MKKQTISSFYKWTLWALLLTFTGGAYLNADDKVRDRIRIRKKTKIERPAVLEGEDQEILTIEKTDLLSQKRKGLIEDIKKFIRESKQGSPQSAELQLRLGSLYMEDYYALLTRAQLVYERDTQLFDQKKVNKKPKYDKSEAVVSLNKARDIYRHLVKTNPKHNRRDEMYYFLAISAMDQGKVSQGMGYLTDLIRSAPSSKYVPDALIQLGDYYFDKSEFKKAEVYYDQVLARRTRPLIPYALYKKGWCSYNQQQVDESLKIFEKIIAMAGEGNSGAARLRNETLRDITLPMADKKLVQPAIEFFKAQGNPHYRNGIETMAALYFEQASYPQAIQLYEHLLALNPADPKNPSYEINIVQCFRQNEKPQEAVQRLFARIPNYLKNSTWYELNASDPKVVALAENSFEEVARKYAMEYHAEAQKTKNPQRYELARQLYGKYLEHFPNNANSPKARFYFAEILYKQNKYMEAADEYYKVYENPTSGSLKNPSIRYALSALDEQLNADRKKSGLKAVSVKTTAKLETKEGEELKLIPYTIAEEKFIKVSAVYLKNYETAKDAPDVLYTKTYLTYLHHDFGQAFKGFWAIIKTYPKHASATVSAHFVLDILNRNQEYVKLIAAAKEFLAETQFGNPGFKSEVSDILRKAELKRIQLVENEGKNKEAGDQYMEYTRAYGPQDLFLFEKALYNASVNYSKAGMLTVAAEVQEQFLRRFPNSSNRKNMLLQVAKTFESLANFEKSGLYFETFSNQYATDPQSKNALRLSALYLGGSGHTDKAETLFHQYAARYPNDAESAHKDIVELYENQNNLQKLIQIYLAHRARKGASYAEYLDDTLKIAELQGQKSGTLSPSLMEEARKIAIKFGKQIRTSPLGVEAFAKTMFYVVHERERAFRSISLAGKQQSVAANLQRKLKLLKELDTEYAHIAGLGSAEWGLAAIYRAAASNNHMADAVGTAPVPAELGPEQIEAYRKEIHKQMVKPFQEKAKGLALSCLDKSQELNLLSAWTSYCYHLVSLREPERFPPARTFYLPAVRLALAVPSRENQIELGSVKKYPYPFYTSLLFDVERMPASRVYMPLSELYNGKIEEKTDVLPHIFQYKAMASDRNNTLKSALDNQKPQDVKKSSTFGYLNLVRLTAPKRAIGLIKDAIQKDPKDYSLHNLLALSYFEAGDLAAARMTWLALTAQGVASAAIWNNLGVLANIQGREDKAIWFFREAAKLPKATEAEINLGFTALKYRNGFEAKTHFKKALEEDSNDVSVQSGLAIGLLQNREMGNAKEELAELSDSYKKDPYLKISLGYYLVDIEQDPMSARRLIQTYMEQQGMVEDLDFRQLAVESRESASKADPDEISGE